MKIDEKAIRKLAGLLEETGLTEIEVAEGEQVLRVAKMPLVSGVPSVAAPPAMASDPTVPQAANTQAPSADIHDHPGAVTSPMVGTAYMAAEPGAAAFVKKGDTIAEGDTLMIIEAMKVMNPIKAHKAGTVTQILVENGQPVEFGDVLMVVE
ncbi:MAG: acetyl-CoA carboxylase biotin carboxyl carrier protein [Alphaproteobacteria bacterium]|nr:acetyl-CoA carboxylase biotin carboxyl carrier protein [Alphaproteobacteria bacterium]